MAFPTIEKALVFGYLASMDGLPSIGRRVQALPYASPKNLYEQGNSDVALLSSPVEVWTNDEGYFSLNIPTGVLFYLKIDDVGYNRLHKVPVGTTSVSFDSLEDLDAEKEDIYPWREDIT